MTDAIYNPNPLPLQPTLDFKEIMEHYKAAAVFVDKPPASMGRVKMYHFEETLKGHALIYMRGQWDAKIVETSARVWAYRRRLTDDETAYREGRKIADADKFNLAVHKLKDITLVVCTSINGRRALPTGRKERWTPPKYFPAWCGMSGRILTPEEAEADMERKAAALAALTAEGSTDSDTEGDSHE